MLHGARQSTKDYGCREVVWFNPGQEVIFWNPLGIGFYPNVCVPGWMEGRVCREPLKLPALGDQSR